MTSVHPGRRRRGTAYAVALIATLASLARPAAAQPAAPAPPPVETGQILTPEVSDPLLTPPPEAPRKIASWDDALALIRTQSPDYISGYQSVLRAEAQKRIVLAAVLPVLTGQGSYTHQFYTAAFTIAGVLPSGATVPISLVSPPVNLWTVGAGLSWAVVDPRGIYQVGTASKNIDVAKLSFTDQRREIALSIVHSMLATLAAERVAEAEPRRAPLFARAPRAHAGAAASTVRARRSTSTARLQDVAVGSSAHHRGDESLLRGARGAGCGARLADRDLAARRARPRPVRGRRHANLPPERRHRAPPRRRRGSRRVEIAERRRPRRGADVLADVERRRRSSPTTTWPCSRPTKTWDVQGVLNVPLYDGGVRYGALTRRARGARAGTPEPRRHPPRRHRRRGAGGAPGRRASRPPAMSPRSQRDLDDADRRSNARRVRQRPGHEPRPGHLGAGPSAGRDRPRPARVSRSRRRGPTQCSSTRSASIDERDGIDAIRAALALTSALALGACAEAKKAAPPPRRHGPGDDRSRKRDVPLYIESVGSLDGYVNADIRARVRGYLRTQDYKDGSRRQVRAAPVHHRVDGLRGGRRRRRRPRCLGRASRRNATASRLERDHGLFKTGMVSQQDLDNATASVADADGQVQAAQAQLDQANLNLSYTQMRSPIDGVAGLALVRVGNLVGQDGPTLLTTVSQVEPDPRELPRERGRLREATPIASSTSRTRDLAWATQAVRRGSIRAARPRAATRASSSCCRTAASTRTGASSWRANRQIDPSTGHHPAAGARPQPRRGAAARAVRARAHPAAGRRARRARRARAGAHLRAGLLFGGRRRAGQQGAAAPGRASGRASRACASSPRASPRATASSSTACRRSPTVRSSTRPPRAGRDAARGAVASTAQRSELEERAMSALLHPPPDRRDGHRDRDRAPRGRVAAGPADRAVPADPAAAGQPDDDVHGRRRADDRAVGGDADRAADERRRSDALHPVDQRQRRVDEPGRDVRRRHRPGHRQRPRQQPLLAGAAASCRRT